MKQEPVAAARRAAPTGLQGPVGISLVHEGEEVKFGLSITARTGTGSGTAPPADRPALRVVPDMRR